MNDENIRKAWWEQRTKWFAERFFLHYKVVLVISDSWAGVGVKYARNKYGFVKRFLTKKAADAYVQKINEWDKKSREKTRFS